MTEMRLRAIRFLNRIGDTMDRPGPMLDSIRTNALAFPKEAARRLRKAAQALCGCHHRTANGCALYVKDGPNRCPCQCHTDEPRDRTFTYHFVASGTDDVEAALRGIEAMRRGRGDGAAVNN